MYHESKIVVFPKTIKAYQAAGFALIFFLVSGMGFYYYWVSSSIERYRQKIDVESQAVERLSQDKQVMGTALERYEAAIDEFKQILFKEKDVALFLTGISAISQKNNVNVISIRNLAERKITIQAQASSGPGSTGSVPADKDLSLVIAVAPFQVEIEGELDDVLSVLSALEQTRQLLTISRFSFSSRGYPRIRAGFQIDLYGLGDKSSDG